CRTGGTTGRLCLPDDCPRAGSAAGRGQRASAPLCVASWSSAASWARYGLRRSAFQGRLYGARPCLSSVRQTRLHHSRPAAAEPPAPAGRDGGGAFCIRITVGRDISAFLARKWRGFSLSVLTSPKLRSAPLLKPHHFRLRTAQITLPYGWGGGLRCNF